MEVSHRKITSEEKSMRIQAKSFCQLVSMFSCCRVERLQASSLRCSDKEFQVVGYLISLFDTIAHDNNSDNCLHDVTLKSRTQMLEKIVHASHDTLQCLSYRTRFVLVVA
eukprot:1243587-Amphidinium_carterae.1